MRFLMENIMSYVYFECNGDAHKKIVEFSNTLTGEEGLVTFVSCHGKDDFIESLSECLGRDL
jgi:hypothetical protein